MTYEEAWERNQSSEIYEDLLPYMEKIVKERSWDLDLDKDGELIDDAAEKMLIADMDGKPITTGEALRLAREEEKNRPQHEAMLKEIEKDLAEIMELRGSEPMSDEDTLRFILSLPDEPVEDNTPKLEPGYARESLKKMAESLRTEACLHDIHYFHKNGLWQVLVRFTDGELSKNAQTTLIQMNHNAHRTMLSHNRKENLQVITFIVTDNNA